MKNNIEGGRRLGKITGKAILMGSLALGAGAAAEVATQDQSSQAVALAVETTGTPDRTVSCGSRRKWVDLKQNETIALNTRGAVVIADISVGGNFQSDDDGNTSTVLGIRSDDRSKKTWNLFINYPGSMLVLPCDVSSAKLDQAGGTWTRKTDTVNDALHRVNGNWLQK